ncbi:MAG: S41 family peptidase [Actinobacteria bacterium]|nr:S41 family peptidase [Actinomycetota bacterium]MBE3092139.1 S41 family peptidase [Chloroflexota bacterium]MBE3115379.1 S41 family peptidase [Actinomycetota bacterium]
MKKNVLRVVIAVIVVIFTFSTGLWIGISFDSFKGYLLKIKQNTTSEIKPIEEIIDLVSGSALVEKSKDELLKAAIGGILSVLDDKYTEYFTAEEYKKIMESYSGTMSGIGVVFTLDDEGQVVVVRILEDTPASRAGIMEGDIITEVDGIKIKDMDLDKVLAMIRGKEGTEVNLKIYRPEEYDIIEVTVTRAIFDVPNLVSEILEEDVGYIWYYAFQDGGAQQLDREIKKLIDGGAKGLILDLRNNPGGVLDDAVEICDLFLDEGIIVTIRERMEDKEIIGKYSAREGKYTEIPLVVLINEFSASASEVVAGALRDNKRAILVGERSYGKGVVQVIYELSDGSGIKFTTAKYFLPSGLSIDGVGINPDVLVKLEPDATEDVQLNRAIEKINTLISEIE